MNHEKASPMVLARDWEERPPLKLSPGLYPLYLLRNKNLICRGKATKLLPEATGAKSLKLEENKKKKKVLPLGELVPTLHLKKSRNF